MSSVIDDTGNKTRDPRFFSNREWYTNPSQIRTKVASDFKEKL